MGSSTTPVCGRGEIVVSRGRVHFVGKLGEGGVVVPSHEASAVGRASVPVAGTGVSVNKGCG